MEQGTKILEKDAKPHDKPEKDKKPHPEQRVEIFVNEKPVVLIEMEHTGLEIKRAAINQGVRIKLDFILSVDLGHGKTKIIGDNEPIKVHKHQKFTAIADDDNS